MLGNFRVTRSPLGWTHSYPSQNIGLKVKLQTNQTKFPPKSPYNPKTVVVAKKLTEIRLSKKCQWLNGEFHKTPFFRRPKVLKRQFLVR